MGTCSFLNLFNAKNASSASTSGCSTTRSPKRGGTGNSSRNCCAENPPLKNSLGGRALFARASCDARDKLLRGTLPKSAPRSIGTTAGSARRRQPSRSVDIGAMDEQSTPDNGNHESDWDDDSDISDIREEQKESQSDGADAMDAFHGEYDHVLDQASKREEKDSEHLARKKKSGNCRQTSCGYAGRRR